MTFLNKTAIGAMGLVLLISVQTLFAQSELPAEQRINGKQVWLAFEPQRLILQQSSAVIYTDEKSRIKSLYGVVVSKDGHILTKASEIDGKEHLSLRVGDQLFTDVERLGVNDEWDVAVLKVSSNVVFTPVELSESDDVEIGHWVVSNGSTSRSRRRVRVGIVGAVTRAIHTAVVLGVQFGSGDEEKLKIEKLSEENGAAKAGMKEGDVLLSAGGVQLKERTDLVKVLKDKNPGEKIAVEVMRDNKKLTFEVELMARSADEIRMDRNDQMSGGEEQLSKRRTGFARVIHHDTPLIKSSVGGPLLTLDGKCIGMNIARASRVATFAIPALELRGIIARMLD